MVARLRTKLIKTMASGSFGCVYKAEHKVTRENCAIKVTFAAEHTIKAAENELRIMQQLALHPHPFILQLRDHYLATTDECPEVALQHIVMDFVPFTLHSLLVAYDEFIGAAMPFFDATLYFYQLLLAVGHMHSLGICHRYAAKTSFKSMQLIAHLHTCYAQRHQTKQHFG